MQTTTPDPALVELSRILESAGGLVAALRFLNGRTPHRFTGIYRYDGDMLRNVRLVDTFDERVTKGDDVAMADAYCAIVGERREDMMFSDAKNDPRFAHKPGSPVVCYCGVLLVDERGEPFGTLCHFDVKPCQAPTNDMPLLRAAAPQILRAIRREERF